MTELTIRSKRRYAEITRWCDASYRQLWGSGSYFVVGNPAAFKP